MAKEICISTTPHETRLAILEDDQLAEIYYERENEYTLAGSVYKGRVTRVLPGMQSSFVDVGLERDAFLYVTDFLEEQEDSEDYETSAPTGGGQARRSERSKGTAEEQESAGSPAVAAGDERRGRRDGRRGSGERSGERSGRGGERGSERVEERAEVAPEQPQQGGRRGAAAEERAAATAALKSAQPAEMDRADKGDDEDSPQGTRRWRGRRGRRRGGMRAGVLGAGSATAAVAESGVLDDSAAQTAAAPFSMPEHGAPGGLAAPLPEAVSQSRQDEQAGRDSQNDQSTQMDQASVDLQAAAAVQPLAREHSPASSSAAGDRSRQGRGDRSSGRGDRAERSAHPSRGDGAVAANTAFLPGESLSKYGGVSSDAAAPKQEAKFALPSKPVNYVAPKPSTLVEVPGGWDGGAVLPGESLSRYQGQASDHAPAREVATGLDQIAAETSPDAFAQSAEDFTTESVTMDAVSSASAHTDSALEAAPQALFPSEREESIQSALDAAAPASGAAVPETVAEALPTAEHPEQQTTSAKPLLGDELGDEQTSRAIAESSAGLDVAPLLGEEEQEPSEAALGEQALTAPHLLPGTDPIIGSPSSDAVGSGRKADEPEAADYDPEGQSASVRVAPPTTSELRFSQLFGGGDREAAAKLPNFEEAKQEPLDSSSKAELPNRATLDAGSDGLQSQGAERTENLSHADRLEEALAPTFGNRFADEPFADSLHQHSIDEHQEDERLEDEQGDQLESEQLPEDAPLSLHLHSVEAAGSGDHFKELVDQLQGFAPGAGLLEEEVIDEEEYDFDPIHAHADEQDLEDLEEETLDGDEELQPFAAMGGAEPAHDPASSTQLPREAVDVFEDEEEDDEPASLLLEEMSDAEEDEEAAPVSTNGDTQRRERGTGDERRGRGGRNGKRRGVGGGSNGGGRRQSAQTQDLPIISDLLKQGQEILVQIAKEPIAKKGARITSHIALPGRFLVFMPTVSHVGVSRKIASDEERQRLKRVLISERGDAQGGFIVRTAAEGASEEELRADLRFLISLWTEIKQRAETAKAPALIYHDLNLVERILRDQVSSNFSTIWVDTEQEYERIVRFLNRFQPALVRRVKLYTKETPLFEHFGIQEEISKALKSKVWLKSGGSIVINQTEALVAIDINTGKYVGKTARLEDTIVKTNLDAIPEIVRQIRLRDLGGIIVIDFIDMDERKNRHRVLAALEEAMKADRAPSKVLQFNDFGLVAITRKRVKQSLERTLSVTCETCAGTGMVKSPITVCNEIYIELRKMQKHLDGKDVLLRVNPEVVKQLKGGNGRWINEYEELVGKTIIIKSDPALHPEQFDIH